MANESTYALISTLIPDIWENAMWYAQHMFVMPRLVTTFSDQDGMEDRKNSLYKETGIQDNVAETADLDSYRYEFDRDLASTLTPKEVGKQFLMTDRRVRTDTENVMADAAVDLGYAAGKKVEQDLLGLFANGTGGQFGDETNSASMNLIQAGRAKLEAAAVPGPYVAVLHPFQWFDIHSAFTNLSNPAPLNIRDLAQSSYYVTQVADITIVVSSLVPTVGIRDEVQTLTMTGTPTGGTFTLKFGGAETAPIAFNASAATVEAALELLPNIGVNLTSSGGPFPGTPVVITFATGQVGDTDVPLMTIGTNALTGGTSPTVTSVETTKGANYARGAIFTRDAFAYDQRAGFRIEPERNASLRAWELNLSGIYAVGTWRPERAVQLRSDASAPIAV